MALRKYDIFVFDKVCILLERQINSIEQYNKTTWIILKGNMNWIKQSSVEIIFLKILTCIELLCECFTEYTNKNIVNKETTIRSKFYLKLRA